MFIPLLLNCFTDPKMAFFAQAGSSLPYVQIALLMAQMASVTYQAAKDVSYELDLAKAGRDRLVTPPDTFQEMLDQADMACYQNIDC